MYSYTTIIQLNILTRDTEYVPLTPSYIVALIYGMWHNEVNVQIFMFEGE